MNATKKKFSKMDATKKKLGIEEVKSRGETYKLTILPIFPIRIPSITINVHAAPNCPVPNLANMESTPCFSSTTGAKNVTRIVSCRSNPPTFVYRINKSSSVPGNFGSLDSISDMMLLKVPLPLARIIVP